MNKKIYFIIVLLIISFLIIQYIRHNDSEEELIENMQETMGEDGVFLNKKYRIELLRIEADKYIISNRITDNKIDANIIQIANINNEKLLVAIGEKEGKIQYYGYNFKNDKIKKFNSKSEMIVFKNNNNISMNLRNVNSYKEKWKK